MYKQDIYQAFILNFFHLVRLANQSFNQVHVTNTIYMLHQFKKQDTIYRW